MVKTPNEEIFSEEETKARAAAALQRMLATPHKPHKGTRAGEKDR
jgi:hypothetical protein